VKGRTAAEPQTLSAAYERCRQLHARHGRTYYLATLLLPRWKRRHVHALYGFVRYADEIVDNLASTLDRPGQAATLTAWGRRFFAGLHGAPARTRSCPRSCTRCGPLTWTQATSSSSLPRWPPT
jgi:phytoene/squalene synthetase